MLWLRRKRRKRRGKIDKPRRLIGGSLRAANRQNKVVNAEKSNLDFVIEGGPRLFTPDVPKSVRFEIAKSSALGPYKDACLLLAQRQVALMHEAIKQTGRENRSIERKATSSHIPHCRIPLLVWDFFEAIYGDGCWQDKDFMDDFLHHHPECKIVVKRGIHGQEYLRPG